MLAEIFAARIVAIPHPAGTLLVYAGDSDGTAIEIWPANLRFDEAMLHDLAPAICPCPEAWPHHCFVTSEACNTETILAVFAREGWRAEHVHNGPPGAGFSLVRGWIENQTAIELGGSRHARTNTNASSRHGGGPMNKLGQANRASSSARVAFMGLALFGAASGRSQRAPGQTLRNPPHRPAVAAGCGRSRHRTRPTLGHGTLRLRRLSRAKSRRRRDD